MIIAKMMTTTKTVNTATLSRRRRTSMTENDDKDDNMGDENDDEDDDYNNDHNNDAYV